jgi:hypothetical protein
VLKPLLAGLLMALSQASGTTNAPVALFVRFDEPPAEQVGEALRAEVDHIMEPAGIRFDWKELPKATGREVYRELVVVRFKGSCRPREQRRWPGSIALGWTHTSDGELLPFIDVECDRVLDVMGSELRAVDPEEREEVLGRALGRVLSHELYHVLGRTRKHGSQGVAKAEYSALELTGDEFLLNESDVERMFANRGGQSSETAETEAGR